MTGLRTSLGMPAAFLISAFLTTTVFAKDATPTTTHLEAAKELLRISRADRIMDHAFALMLPQQINSIKALRPDIPDEALKRLSELFKTAFRKNIREFKNMHGFMDVAATTYARHLSEADMKAAIEFYKSEAGQNLIKNQPAMINELAKFGLAMGQEIAGKSIREAIGKLKQEGYDL